MRWFQCWISKLQIQIVSLDYTTVDQINPNIFKILSHFCFIFKNLFPKQMLFTKTFHLHIALTLTTTNLFSTVTLFTKTHYKTLNTFRVCSKILHTFNKYRKKINTLDLPVCVKLNWMTQVNGSAISAVMFEHKTHFNI